MINMKLAERQGLTEEEVVTVMHLQLVRRGLVRLANTYVLELQGMSSTDTLYPSYVKGLRVIYKSWVRNEFDLQRAWKFLLEARWHRFWEFPGCTCPKLYNINDYPYLQYHSEECLLHGNSDLTQVAE